jgi:DMSO/TMAO reductase YedYZ molybdopterin-dependent catalytic subunit
MTNKPFLITRSLDPENQETPIKFLTNEFIPINYFFRRNHFQYPNLFAQNFILPITGEVNKPLVFHLNHLFDFPSTSFTGLLECSGNNRSKFEPKVFGEQWEDGAISQGKWRGVPLRDLLSITGITTNAKEVLFEGYDFGNREEINKNIPFERSLPIEKALHQDTIIAYEYNGKPLSIKHGYPFRLIVPGWYGMASVKWLKKITVIDYHFKGPFQADDYVYYPKDTDPFPVTTINVNSIIKKPLDYSILNSGIHIIEGIAWTGEGEITNVEVSVDGHTWFDTTLSKNSEGKYGWSKWRYHWEATRKGEYTIFCRATDTNGNIQPVDPVWNKKGYGYNAISKIRVKVK